MSSIEMNEVKRRADETIQLYSQIPGIGPKINGIVSFALFAYLDLKPDQNPCVMAVGLKRTEEKYAIDLSLLESCKYLIFDMLTIRDHDGLEGIRLYATELLMPKNLEKKTMNHTYGLL